MEPERAELFDRSGPRAATRRRMATEPPRARNARFQGSR